MQLFTPAEYMKIDIANGFGLDKKKWHERLEWFEANKKNLRGMLRNADEPALYLAAVQSYERAKEGLPVHYPISLDATSSGMQLLACLTRDRQTAALCNVIDSGEREDAYTKVYEAMLVKVGEGGKIKRDDLKSAIMTSLYGSEAVPKQVFGEGELLEIFEQTMAEEAPLAWELNKGFLNMWQKDALSHDWVMPDNFHVHVKVMGKEEETVHFLNEPFTITKSVNKPTEKGRSIGANVCHSLDSLGVREITRRCMFDPDKVQRIRDWLFYGDNTTLNTESNNTKMLKKLLDLYNESGFLSARILDYIQKDNISLVPEDALIELLNNLPKKPFEVLCVHDCFKVLPPFCNDLRKQYNLFLAMLARSNMLNFLASQIVQREVKIEVGDPELWKDILEANYALS